MDLVYEMDWLIWCALLHLNPSPSGLVCGLIVALPFSPNFMAILLLGSLFVCNSQLVDLLRNLSKLLDLLWRFNYATPCLTDGPAVVSLLLICWSLLARCLAP